LLSKEKWRELNRSTETSSEWIQPKIVDIPVRHTEQGALGVVENSFPFPKEIKRVYFLYDIPSGVERGSHAHKALHQLIIAMSGSFIIDLDNGNLVESFKLNNPSEGLYIPPGYWRTLRQFSSGAAVVVLASEEYQEDDYIRNYEEFLEWKK
jgi:hypothetical protein